MCIRKHDFLVESKEEPVLQMTVLGYSVIAKRVKSDTRKNKPSPKVHVSG